MKRTLIVRAAALTSFALLGWIAYTQTQAAPKLTISRVKDNLYEIEGDGGNVAALVTNEGVLLIDDKYEQDHAGIVDAVKSVNLSADPVHHYNSLSRRSQRR